MLISFISLFMTTWANMKAPMDSKLNNFVFIFNEYFLLFTGDLVLLFSDFVIYPTSRYKFGYLYLALFYLSAFVNVGLMIYTLKQNIKKWY